MTVIQPRPGGTAGRLGDQLVGILRGMAENDFLNLTQLEQFALRLNALEQSASQVRDWTSGPGKLSPDILGNSEPFRVLPHEVASLRFSTQAISSGTTFQVPAADALNSNNASWQYGFSVDTSSSTISVNGQDKNAIIGFVLWWQWAANATGHRALQWQEVAAGNAVRDFEFNPDASVETFLYISHVRRVSSTDTTYRPQVYQSSGGDLSGDGLMVAYRIR